jgi:hypothetical protein
MKQWKGLLVVLLAALLVIGVSGVASAEEVSGTGKLEAWGDGLARVMGNCKVEVSGSGALYFGDLKGDATWSIEGRGRRVNLRNGWTAWYGFHGSLPASPIIRVLDLDPQWRLSAAGSRLLGRPPFFPLPAPDVPAGGSR